jgi:LmbE family N-acetylglucosaminyl deacetylase
VLTIFNGPGDGEKTTLGWWDRLTRADSPLARADERAEEDRAALALAGREPLNLGFVDGQYRDGEQDIEPLREAIAAAVPEGSLLLAPAALDRHRDHLAVRAAAQELRTQDWQVSLYADVPHATIHGWPTWVTGEPATEHLDPEAFWDLAMNGSGTSVRGLKPEVHALDPAQESAKREAVGRYVTQLDALEAQFSMLKRPEVLRYEVTWPLP